MNNLGFPVAAAALLECGAHVRRAGWRNKFHLELEEYGVYTSAVMVRVSDDGKSRTPWSVVTEDDTLATDWEIVEGTATSEVPEDFRPSLGTYAHALSLLLTGAFAIRMPVGWHPEMQVRLVDGEIKVDNQIVSMGKVMVLRLPGGMWKYFRPAPQDLNGAWAIVDPEEDEDYETSAAS